MWAYSASTLSEIFYTTTNMHGVLCRGSPDHGMLNLQSKRISNHTHHTCIYFPHVPGCEITTEQLGWMFLGTRNTCTGLPFPLRSCPMFPYHGFCHAWSRRRSFCNSQNNLYNYTWMGTFSSLSAWNEYLILLCYWTSVCSSRASLQLSFLSPLSLCFMLMCLFRLAALKNFCGQKGHGVFLWVARWTLNVAAVLQYMLHLPHTKPLRAPSGPACAGCSGCLVAMCCFSTSWSLCGLWHWWHTRWFFLAMR